ncbi:hypothetical protein [Streptomyces sp. NPDC127098]|uniref:hypothetical protein n=1 Tax=Streptomyces sp. NPDC127098 TaxID=3347137 RepID=UPI0036561127
MTTDSYVFEESPDGEDREFWAQTAGSICHTLEIRDTGEAVSLDLWSEAIDLDAPEWSGRVEMHITYSDVRKMIARLTRICERHELDLG